MNKYMKTLKNNTSNIIFIAIAIILLFSTDAKAFLQQGLMKVGLFQPKLEQPFTKNNPEKAPNFIMRNLDGEIIALDDLKGKVVFLNFWATWCPPCIAEMPSIQQLSDKFKDDHEVMIMTLEVDGNIDKINKFIKRKKLSLNVVVPHSQIPNKLYDGTLPTTIIIDKKGNIAHTTLGMADYSGQDIVDFLNEIKTMN